jgi:hypothetical protein
MQGYIPIVNFVVLCLDIISDCKSNLILSSYKVNKCIVAIYC